MRKTLIALAALASVTVAGAANAETIIVRHGHGWHHGWHGGWHHGWHRGWHRGWHPHHWHHGWDHRW